MNDFDRKIQWDFSHAMWDDWLFNTPEGLALMNRKPDSETSIAKSVVSSDKENADA